MAKKTKAKKTVKTDAALVDLLTVVNEIVKPGDALKDSETAGDKAVTKEIKDLIEEVVADDAGNFTEETMSTLESIAGDVDGVSDLREAFDALQEGAAKAKDKKSTKAKDKKAAKPAAGKSAKAPGKQSGTPKQKKDKTPRPNRVDCLADAAKKGGTREEIIEAADKAFEKAGGTANVKESKFVARYCFRFLEAMGIMTVEDDGQVTIK